MLKNDPYIVFLDFDVFSTLLARKSLKMAKMKKNLNKKAIFGLLRSQKGSKMKNIKKRIITFLWDHTKMLYPNL